MQMAGDFQCAVECLQATIHCLELSFDLATAVYLKVCPLFQGNKRQSFLRLLFWR